MEERIFMQLNQKPLEGSSEKVISGLYYKNISTIVSDDHNWHLYYKCAYP